MRVLVTGATGFIGVRLCEALANRGHEILGLSRNLPVERNKLLHVLHFNYQMGDDLPEDVVNFSPEVIVHLAWDGIPDFSATKCYSNVVTQIKFLAETKKLPNLVKILVAGSCAEYGSKSGICHEAEKYPPNNYFSWAKQTLENYFNLFCKEKEIQLLWFRVFFVYGPGQRSASLIPYLLNTFLSGKNPEIKNSNAANDFIYVDDVVDAFLRGVELDGAVGTINLGSGKLTAVEEVAKIAERACKKNMKLQENFLAEFSIEKSILAMTADISNAKAILGWAPKVSLTKGIALTLGASA